MRCEARSGETGAEEFDPRHQAYWCGDDIADLEGADISLADGFDDTDELMSHMLAGLAPFHVLVYGQSIAAADKRRGNE